MKHWFLNNNKNKIQNRAICYVYDSIVDDFNIDFIFKNYMDSYYILPTRNFKKWLVSVIIHFNYLEIDGMYVYNFIIKRNLHYEKLLDKFKDRDNLLIVNIDTDNIQEKILNFLPENYTEFNKIFPLTNITAKTNFDKVLLSKFIDDVFQILNIDIIKNNEHLLITDNNNDIYKGTTDENILNNLRDLKITLGKV